MENVRFNISPCSPAESVAFVEKIDKSVYADRGSVKADGRSHYDRYSFVRADSKVAVVYDTSANVLSITAPQTYADELLALFAPVGKTIKRSTVPAQNSAKREPPRDPNTAIPVGVGDTRAKLFVSPESLSRRGNARTTTVIITNDQEISTDEIFPPQRAKPRPKSPPVPPAPPRTEQKKAPSVDAYFAAKAAEPLPKRPVGRPRKATISFGDSDEGGATLAPAKSPIIRSGTGLYADIASPRPEPVQPQPQPVAKKRGRPRKQTADADLVQPPDKRDQPPVKEPQPEYKNGFSVRNLPQDKLDAMLKRLKTDGYTVRSEGTEFAGTVQEVRSYVVLDASGSKAYLRYATNKMTIQLQGKRSELFGELQSKIGGVTDYSAAIEGYIEAGSGGAKKHKASDVENKLKKRLPTAYAFLSEQSRIDFSYGIHDFSQSDLRLSDYSVLLVPPFRGLERLVFDLQRAEDIKVKMIGQAFDKDDAGNYVLKNGYCQRIGSVVYAEVMVALYSEYFSRRNFFAHSDNSDDSRSRAIPDRNVAKQIFEHLLDTVEYNAKKLKEIGFKISDK